MDDGVNLALACEGAQRLVGLGGGALVPKVGHDGERPRRLRGEYGGRTPVTAAAQGPYSYLVMAASPISLASWKKSSRRETLPSDLGSLVHAQAVAGSV